MANRTKQGNVTQEARKQHGAQAGRFPIFDERSARAALRLRGHAHSKAERSSIIRRAARYAPAAAKRARQADKESGKL